ncbi:hypothetical protein FRB95_008964 [Tulasnella sp. JGI-2019a]|nr:hypothetical protein FRB95_008964 [Tulasnella sp. JGI-2019a]
MSFISEPHHYSSSASPLQLTAKRYYLAGAVTNSVLAKERYTLVCLHGSGLTKECWEPVLEVAFNLLSAAGTNAPFIIEEAWAIGWQNHGEAGTLNAELLGQPPLSASFEYTDWYPGIYDFIKTRVHKPECKLIGVGHSYGSTAILLLAEEHPTLFKSMVLFDPMLHIGPKHEEVALQCGKMFVAFACTRRDVWPSKKAALKDLQAHPILKTWDPRQLELFVEYGLMEHTAAAHDYSFKGVTLRCTRDQEAATIRSAVNFRHAVIPRYNQITNTIPTYMCFGDRSDSVPRKFQDALIDPNLGRIILSTRIPKAGHLVVLQQPTACGETLFDFLHHFSDSQALSSNLTLGPVARITEEDKASGGSTAKLASSRL